MLVAVWATNSKSSLSIRLTFKSNIFKFEQISEVICENSKSVSWYGLGREGYGVPDAEVTQIPLPFRIVDN